MKYSRIYKYELSTVGKDGLELNYRYITSKSVYGKIDTLDRESKIRLQLMFEVLEKWLNMYSDVVGELLFENFSELKLIKFPQGKYSMLWSFNNKRDVGIIIEDSRISISYCIV